MYAHVFGTGRTDVTVQNNTLNDVGNVGGLPIVTLFYDGGGNGAYPNTSNRYVVSNNTMNITGTTGFSVNINSVASPRQQTVSGKADNNTIAGVATTGFATGLDFSIGDNLNSQLVMQANGNSMSNIGGGLININRGSGTANMDLTVLNNTAVSATPNAFSTVTFNFCPSSTTNCTGNMRIHVAGNNIHGFDAGLRSFRLRQLFPNSLGVRAFEGFTGSDQPSPDAFLKSANTNVDNIQYSSTVPSPFYTGVVAGSVLLPP